MTKKQMLEQHKIHLRKISMNAIKTAEFEVRLAETNLLLAKNAQMLGEKEEFIEELEEQYFDLTVEFNEYKRTYPTDGTPTVKASEPRETDPLNKYDCEEGERVANLFSGNDCDILDKEEENETGSLFT